MGIIGVDLNNNNNNNNNNNDINNNDNNGNNNNNNKLDHVAFSSDECQTFIHVICRDSRNRLKQRKLFKKGIS